MEVAWAILHLPKRRTWSDGQRMVTMTIQPTQATHFVGCHEDSIYSLPMRRTWSDRQKMITYVAVQMTSR